MKKFICFLLSAALAVGCSKDYDDASLWNSVNSLEDRVATLEELCRKMNTNISAMQTIVDAIQSCDYVTGIAPVTKDGVEIGYTISFYKHDPVTIYHGENGKDGADGTDGKDGQNGTDGKNGEDGKDGADGQNGKDGQDGQDAPVIGIRQDTDGNWYWTADGEWLRDTSGQKVRANGSDGRNGQDGSDGKDGQDGADGQNGRDGITPQLKIENEYWYVSYDKGKTWSLLGKATGGSGSDNMFSGIDTSNDEYIVFMLQDGTRFQLPTWYAFESLRTLCNQMNTNIEALQTLVEALQSNDYITSVSPLAGNGKVVGYTISFAHSSPIVIYHGKDGQNGSDGKDGQDGQNGADGKDGHSPVVSIRQHTDGNWYWVLDGNWLLDDNGQKVRANGKDGADGQDGTDGKDGQDGQDGADGQNGKDGITPQLKIENGRWLLSLDNGKSWKDIGQATGKDGQDGADGQDGKDGANGQDGKDGDSMFLSVTNGESEVTFVLADGTSFSIPKDHPFDITFDTTEAIRFSLGSSYRIGYTLTGADALTQVEAIAQDGLKATVEMTDETTGAVVVRTPLTIVERSTVVVLLSDGRGKTLMKALNFVYDGSGNIGEGVLIITTAEPFDIAAAGGTVDVPLQTNLNYRVEISDAAKGWLSQMPKTRAALREETLTFRAAVNAGGLRRAFVYLIDLADESIAQTLCITQQADETQLSETISFVDPTFEALILNSYDQDHDGKLSKREALDIESLYLPNKYVSDLTGIEWFTNLRSLDCSSNTSLAKLDVSKNTALESLNCSGCKQIVALDLSKNEALVSLDFSETKIAAIDLSSNKALTSLKCKRHVLSSLDLSHNSELLEVDCNGDYNSRPLRLLNISGCTKLRTLDCQNNSLTSLNVSGNPALEVFLAQNNALSGLDVSHNPKLKELNCSANFMSVLDVSGNFALKTLDAGYNPLTAVNLGTIPNFRSLDLSVQYSKLTASLKITAPALTSLSLNEKSSYLQNVDLSSCPAIETLTIGVAAESYDLSVLPKLKELNIVGGVTTLDLRGNPELSVLTCRGGHNLMTLDISQNTALQKLDLYGTKISSLDLSAHKSLSYLDVSNMSDLVYLNLGDNPYITSLQNTWGAKIIVPRLKLISSKIKTLDIGSYSKISMLDLTECPALETLKFEGGAMKTIDLSRNSKLKTLECSNGELESLDLSHNSELASLECHSNKLKSLDVTQCPLLATLSCWGNYLETLDVSGSPALTSLKCCEMPTLTTLFMAPSQKIRYITYERSNAYIPDQTVIEYR